MSASRQAEKYIVRMPPGMRDAIRQIADRNHRSMNAEIVHHLDAVLRSNSQIDNREARS